MLSDFELHGGESFFEVRAWPDPASTDPRMVLRPLKFGRFLVPLL
jgi:hypothetical protein